MNKNTYSQLDNNWNLEKYVLKSTPSNFNSCRNECNISNKCSGFILTKDDKCYIYQPKKRRPLKNLLLPLALSDNSNENSFFLNKEIEIIDN